MADKDNREVIARRLREPKHDLTVNYAVWKAGQLIYRIHSDLYLADLNPKTLRRMGVSRADLLDSTADQYIYTREYALAIHQRCPQAHGLQWSSRQHGDTALMLFEDRFQKQPLQTAVESEPLSSPAIMAIIEEQADQLGLVLL